MCNADGELQVAGSQRLDDTLKRRVRTRRSAAAAEMIRNAREQVKCSPDVRQAQSKGQR